VKVPCLENGLPRVAMAEVAELSSYFLGQIIDMGSQKREAQRCLLLVVRMKWRRRAMDLEPQLLVSTSTLSETIF
jgi:hypothetical protein